MLSNETINLFRCTSYEYLNIKFKSIVFYLSSVHEAKVEFIG